jgi:NSS family neurotransmitter:Na+ symporter
MKRERWGSKLGVILAVAGSAIGLGNFLRFPVQAVKNGGGAFIVPYLISLFLLGIPLMWIEWTLGRFGGGFGHGTAPGIFHTLCRKNKFIKYFGVIGIFGPVVIFIYYTYIESWLLAYVFFPFKSDYSLISTKEQMIAFLQGYQGIVKNQYFSSILPAYFFFLITFFINLIIVYFGIRRGIEIACKIGMPSLFFLALILLIRVLTLKNPVNPDWTPLNGFGFLWNPDFSSLKDAKVWLSASGQIFFTLSVGIGVILTYASYLSKDDDVLLSGLTSASANEFAEVILGGSIIIPAAYVFLGPIGIKEVANQGAFDLGFITMPLILKSIPFGKIFEILWFLLLFIAGLTSSISLIQPSITFLEDEFNLSKKKSVLIFGTISFLLSNLSILFLSKGVVDELDFWGGTFSLVLFGTIETILFAWVFRMDKAWEEMHSGSDIRLPRIYKFIIKYITPLFLITILISWTIQHAIPTLLLKNLNRENLVYILMTRIILLSLFIGLCILVKISWSKKGEKIET